MSASVRLYGIPVGILEVEREGRLSFRYDADWLSAPPSAKRHPISMSMPFDGGTYGHDKAGPFFGGLLPDGKRTRDTLARYFGFDPDDDYGLLFNLGRECPGAISILPMDAEVIPETAVKPEYDVLDEERLAEHIANLPSRPLFVDADGEMRLSLPGVHHKTAVLVVNGQVAMPRGRTATSHILKVDIDGLPDSIKVENFCLVLAGELGIDVPKSTIREAAGKAYMLISRYDRALVHGKTTYVRRLHQEDFCQATSRFPFEKYEKGRGPGWKDCFALMDRMTDPGKARAELLERAIFQFLVNNPDAHAKNYSIVHRGGDIALSKLYDVNNAAAFKSHYKEQRARLAMFVGGERNPNLLESENWTAFAAEVGLSPDYVLTKLASMAAAMPPAARAIRERMKGTPAASELFDLAIEDIEARCERVLSWGNTVTPKR